MAGILLRSAAPLPNTHSNKFLSLKCGPGEPGLSRWRGRGQGALSGMGAGDRSQCGEGRSANRPTLVLMAGLLSPPPGQGERGRQAPPPGLPHAHPGCMNRPMQKLPHVTPQKKKCHAPFHPPSHSPPKLKFPFHLKAASCLCVGKPHGEGWVAFGVDRGIGSSRERIKVACMGVYSGGPDIPLNTGSHLVIWGECLPAALAGKSQGTWMM